MNRVSPSVFLQRKIRQLYLYHEFVWRSFGPQAGVGGVRPQLLYLIVPHEIDRDPQAGQVRFSYPMTLW